MKYSLVRTRDGAGDSGQMSMAITLAYDHQGDLAPQYEHGARPRLGVIMRVGSIYARTYSMQDYWQTTPITEILEDREDYVRFKTANSEYEWRTF